MKKMNMNKVKKALVTTFMAASIVMSTGLVAQATTNGTFFSTGLELRYSTKNNYSTQFTSTLATISPYVKYDEIYDTGSYRICTTYKNSSGTWITNTATSINVNSDLLEGRVCNIAAGKNKANKIIIKGTSSLDMIIDYVKCPY